MHKNNIWQNAMAPGNGQNNILNMKICDRCRFEVRELIELNENIGGGEVCQSCVNEINKAFQDFTDQHITPLYKKRREYVKNYAHGFKLVE